MHTVIGTGFGFFTALCFPAVCNRTLDPNVFEDSSSGDITLQI